MKIVEAVHAGGCRFKSGRPRKSKNLGLFAQGLLIMDSVRRAVIFLRIKVLNWYTFDMVVFVSVTLLLISSLGVYLAYLYGRKTKRFQWSEYTLFIAVPVVACLSLGYVYGIKVFELFVVGAVAGFALEYVVGLTYHKTLNRHLWYYSRLKVGNGYTSLLVVPMWGVAGILFWLLAQNIGL